MYTQLHEHAKAGAPSPTSAGHNSSQRFDIAHRPAGHTRAALRIPPLCCDHFHEPCQSTPAALHASASFQLNRLPHTVVGPIPWHSRPAGARNPRNAHAHAPTLTSQKWTYTEPEPPKKIPFWWACRPASTLPVFRCRPSATSASASTQHSRNLQPSQARQATCVKASVFPALKQVSKSCIPGSPVTTMPWIFKANPSIPRQPQLPAHTCSNLLVVHSLLTVAVYDYDVSRYEEGNPGNSLARNAASAQRAAPVPSAASAP
jgi:hypothetical protein